MRFYAHCSKQKMCFEKYWKLSYLQGRFYVSCSEMLNLLSWLLFELREVCEGKYLKLLTNGQ